MNRMIHPKGAENLMRAIVHQARNDYLHSKPESESRKEVERFFASEYFTALTGLEGSFVLKHLEAEYKAKQKKRRD